MFDHPRPIDIKSSAIIAALMTNQANRILADIQALAPEITRRAVEIETGCRVPLDLVDKLRSIGIFRVLAPRSHGGLELDMPVAIAIIKALCRVDGLVGWASMLGIGSALFAPLVARHFYGEIYEKGPDIFFAGSVQPGGTAEAVNGGWRVSGRWPFASGCQEADWIFGMCVMSKDGKPLAGPMGENGPPMMRGFFLPADEWQIEDTCIMLNLSGTGSHHVLLKDKVIPSDKFFAVGGESCMTGPLYQGPSQFISLMHFAAATGIAAGAFDDLIRLANTGRQQQSTNAPMRDLETFQYELGRVEADLRTIRAFADVQIETHWRHALAGTLRGEALQAQAATWITSACVRIVDECFRLGGGSALYDSSPLQRRMSDLRIAAQHAVVHQQNYGNSGRLSLDRSQTASPPWAHTTTATR